MTMSTTEKNTPTTERIDPDDIKTARKAWKPPTKGLKSAFEGGIPLVQVGDEVVIEYPAGWRDTSIGEIVSMDTNGNFFILEQGTTSHVGSNFFKGLERGIRFWKYDPKAMKVAREEAASVKVGRLGGGRTQSTGESLPTGKDSLKVSSGENGEEPKRKRGRPRKNPVAE